MPFSWSFYLKSPKFKSICSRGTPNIFSINALSMHWHIWDHASIAFFFFFLAFHLVGVKCQLATFGHPLWYSPTSLKKRCRDIVSPQSSVKINQISLDESGEHVGICSEDGKVRSLHSSPLASDLWACSKKWNHQSVLLIFHNSSSDSYKLALSAWNFIIMIWN